MAKSIFVTGGASGLGLATCRHFHEMGWLVGLADVDRAGLDRAVAELGAERAKAFDLDVRSRPAWDAALASFAKDAGGHIDVLVNCAGAFRRIPFPDLKPGDFDLEIDVNLRGVLHGCHAVLPYMGSGKGGTIINIASNAGLYGVNLMVAYSATKGAVRALTESLDFDLAPLGIRAACIFPGVTDTPGVDKLTDPEWGSLRESVKARGVKMGKAEDLARLVAKVLETDDLHYGFAGHEESVVTVLREVRAQRRALLAKA